MAEKLILGRLTQWKPESLGKFPSTTTKTPFPSTTTKTPFLVTLDLPFQQGFPTTLTDSKSPLTQLELMSKYSPAKKPSETTNISLPEIEVQFPTLIDVLELEVKFPERKRFPSSIRVCVHLTGYLGSMLELVKILIGGHPDIMSSHKATSKSTLSSLPLGRKAGGG